VRPQPGKLLQHGAVRLRRPVGDLVRREQLARKRRGLERSGCVGTVTSRRDRTSAHHLLDREKRLAGFSAEHQTWPDFVICATAGMSCPVAADRDEVGRRRRIAIPKVVAGELVVPHVFARRGIEHQQAIRIQVVAAAVAAPEIKRRRPDRAKHEARSSSTVKPDHTLTPPTRSQASAGHVFVTGLAGCGMVLNRQTIFPVRTS